MLIYLQTIEAPRDKSKFEQVYHHWRGLMYHVAFRVLNNEQDAEDAVQQAFEAIAKNISKISDPLCSKTRAYVVTIVENKAIDLYRAKQRRAAAPLNEEAAGLTFNVPEGGLAAAIGRLPARYRELILLKYAEGYKNEELMKMLGLSYSGVQSLDHRAKQKLRKLLREEGIDV